MAKLTKKQKAQDGKVDSTKLYPLADALNLVKEHATAKFDESIDVAVQLGIDAKNSDQVVRGAVVMPNGIGKTKRVAVFAQGAKAEEAKAAGADLVGMDDLAAQVKAGDMPFDVVIAAPDAMRVVGTLGQILGPRGLMPNPKVGTVTPDVATAVKNAKAGQVQFRVDKAGIIHGTIGRRSFDSDKLQGKGVNLNGSSALMRHSIAWPLIWICRCVNGSFSPAATMICVRTMSMPVISSVTGCSTWTRVFISMK